MSPSKHEYALISEDAEVYKHRITRISQYMRVLLSVLFCALLALTAGGAGYYAGQHAAPAVGYASLTGRLPREKHQSSC